ASAMCHVGGAGLFPMRTAQTDAQGRCVVTGLPEGRWVVMAIADYAGSGERQFEVGPEQPTDPVGLTLKQTPPLVISVVDPAFADDDVVAGEGALDAALVTIARDPLHVWSFYDVTDADGIVTFHGLGSGTWYITVRAS